MTANELLWSIDGNVRLDVKLGLSSLTIKSAHGGGAIANTVRCFPGLDPDTILNAPARIKEPIGDFTDVFVDMDEVKKANRMKKS